MVTAAVAGGIDMVQIREKDMPAVQLMKLCRTIRDLTAGKAMLFVNDRVDVAMACGADGVQLGEESLSPSVARRIAGEDLLLGRSVHSVEGAQIAEAQGSDLLVIGTVFSTSSHPLDEAAGTGLLERLRDSIEAPYLAIGGVSLGNIESVISSGASGAAVISAICSNNDPEGATRALKAKVIESWALRQINSRGTSP